MSAATEDLLAPIEDEVGPREVPIKYCGKEYVLREAVGAAVKEFRATQIDNIKVDPDTRKPQGFRSGVLDAQYKLASRCLFERESNAPVPVAALLTWKDSFFQKVFERLKRLSDLDREEDTDSIKEKIADLQRNLEARETEEARLGKS